MCCDAFEKLESDASAWAWQWFDEDDAVVWVRLLRVQTLDADWHDDRAVATCLSVKRTVRLIAGS